MTILRTAMMVCGLGALAATQASSAIQSFVPDFRVNPDDYTVLMAADAKRPPGLKPFQAGAHGKFHVTGWMRPEQTLEWVVMVPKEDVYAVNVLPRRDGNQPLTVEVTSAGQTLSGAITSLMRGWTVFGLLTSADGKSWTMLPE